MHAAAKAVRLVDSAASEAQDLFSPPRSAWDEALLAVAVLAVDPGRLGGLHLRARPGPVRDRWLEELARCFGPAVPIRRVAASVPDDRLLGGLDIGRTLALGRPVVELGVLAAADGGVLVLGMAERLSPGGVAIIGAALDAGEVRIEREGLSARQSSRFALVALDEGIDDEALAPALADRLGLHLGLDAIGWRDIGASVDPASVATARRTLASVVAPPAMMEALCAVSLVYGGPSLRQPLFLLRTARACAALRGSAVVEGVDAEAALRLVLGLQALANPAGETGEGSAPDDAAATSATMPSDNDVTPQGRVQAGEPPLEMAKDDSAAGSSAEALQEMLVAAISACLPPNVLNGLAQKSAARRAVVAAGKAGADGSSGRRGRVIGTLARPPVSGARLDVLATLRQAAPWQRIRAAGKPDSAGAEAPGRLSIRPADFRYLRRRERAGTTAIFAVDASGSAAVERLAETKGAIEYLLADCYVRRDSVGLVAFRGREAATLLEPTRSLVRAKRSLTALPGGGGTPLAGGIMAALDMAMTAQGRGQSVFTVFLTDGRGNIALDGSISRGRVEDDTQRAARLFKHHRLRAIVIDTAQRGRPRAEALARDLGAEYLVLPRGGSEPMARLVGARMDG